MKISVVVPVYNEESNIVKLVDKISNILNGYNFELIFIDDGSQDSTLEILKKVGTENPNIHYLSLSRNFGHQSALKAGIDFASGDCIISMDGDLQHPPEIIHLMIEKWKEGYNIVYTQRKEDNDLSFFKQLTSVFFYKLMNFLSDINIEPGTADFRLIDRKVADIIKNMKEYHLFIRGYVSWIGFKKYKIDYSPNKRHSGTTKYSIKKMISFAINGITSFSIRPLRLAILFGIIISSVSFLYALYALYAFLFSDRVISGWASVIISVLLIGGIQLIVLGIIGEYIGKIFIQAKERPMYIISENSLTNQLPDNS